MTIDDKYVKLLGKYVYNKRLDKFGYISSIEMISVVGGLCVYFKTYYDSFDSSAMTSFEDFTKGDIQFAIITDYDTMSSSHVEDIKEAFGDSFSEDMLRYVTDSEKKVTDTINNNRNTQMLHTDMVDLTNISTDVVADDFYSREIYLKYKKGVLTKEQTLYALVNHLAQELKRIKDRNLEYFIKYELSSEMEKGECEI